MFLLFNSLFGDLFYTNGLVESEYVNYIAYSHYFISDDSGLFYYRKHDFHATYGTNLLEI